MRRLSACTILMALTAVFLTGCSQAVDLTLEEKNIIANYAARVIVKTTQRDYTYTPDIQQVVYNPGVYESETDENGNVIAAPHDYSELADYLGMENVMISYKGCSVSKEYPQGEDVLFVLDADEGRRLVVVEYEVTNAGDAELVYSTPEDMPIFRLVVDENTKIRSFKNILVNDFSNMNSFTIAPGETKTAIIVFDLDETQADSLSYIEVQYGAEGRYISLPVEIR